MMNESKPRARLANNIALTPRKIVTPQSIAWTICSKFAEESFTPENVGIRALAREITRAIFTVSKIKVNFHQILKEFENFLTIKIVDVMVRRS